MIDELDTKNGLKTALADAHDPSAPVPGSEDGEQLDLLGLQAIADRARAAGLVTGPRRAGRPKGAKNKNTKQWQDFILQQYSSPLQVLASVYTMDTEELARALGCTKIEAFKLQLQCAKETAPYVHQKMPLAIDAGEGGLIGLTINVGGAGSQRAAEEVRNAAYTVLDVDEEIQPLSYHALDHSNETTSNENAQDDENAE